METDVAVWVGVVVGNGVLDAVFVTVGVLVAVSSASVSVAVACGVAVAVGVRVGVAVAGGAKFDLARYWAAANPR